jgi:hypothetical protein
MKRLLPLMLLAGCASAPTAETLGPAPAAWKETLRAYMLQTYKDPYSLRDVAVADPVPGTFSYKQGWVACVRVNAKNAYGGYTGLQTTGFVFEGDHVLIGDDNNAACRQDLAYIPWPEMNGQ